MCIAVPGEVIELFSPEARVKIMGVETIVNIQLIEHLKVGEHVLIHVGCAIEKIDRSYYDDLLGILESMVDGNEKEDRYR
ncbi:HypC/HybG/HupF family hydrogenase formation chaperone [Geosporobacter ferrireducens]|uniref:Hydrogenase assembly protein HypC n=1 Tax=Geosporobacter ferrireducens TaxID=1424294 RepID=A0A1D8GET4_9FIRM|nr:HypC/HybG/HupF family hydrogenase formation chaperone [Geosporobacter ferrireducens]AOT69424.1 hydrogenase assembly protein HypC [Geosporobacter ferrireducens]MTI56535.1 HypC/HybG/HupF family hydrogenase formation chaperone [Geosporobacter ferrireducens]